MEKAVPGEGMEPSEVLGSRERKFLVKESQGKS